jgi:CBS domain-containing protein
LGDILNNNLAFKLLVLVAVCKSVALLLSLGSGTSGGLLAPMFMCGAAVGGLFAAGIDRLIPSAHLSPGACALVAMAAVFGSASRATFTFIVFAFEIVHDFNAVLPLMLVSVTADAVAMRYLPNSIMTEKLARRGLHTHNQYESNVTKQVKVADVMTQDVTTVPAELTVRELADRIAGQDPGLRHHRALPIVDSAGRLAGLITQSDLLRALEKDPGGMLTVLDAGTRSLVVAYPDERVFDAIAKMLENNIGQLPVVDRSEPRRMVGYVNRSSVIQSWSGHLDEESIRERGWIRQWLVDLKKKNEAGRGIATGRVAYLADDRIRILVDGKEVELAEEFALKAPARGVSVGDAVRVSYQNDDGGKYVLRIEELSSRQ